MMKKNLALLVLALTGVFGTYKAQAQDDCNTNLSLFANDAKVKNYESAYGSWKKVFDNCPQNLHVAIYVYGDDILEYKIENDAANKTQYINMLLELYDRYHANYKDDKKYGYSYAESVIDKVRLKEKHGMITDQEIYDQLKEAFEKDKANFNSEIALYMYFTKTVDLYKAQKLELQVVFDAYDDVSTKIETLRNNLSETMNPLIEQEEAGTLDAKGTKSLSNARKRMENYDGITESLNAYVEQYYTCENLIPLYTKDFEQKKTDEQWLTRAAGSLTDKECTSDPLYAKIVEQLHGLKPSANSAYFLGVLAYKKGDTAGAKKWFKEAVDLEQDKFKKADYLLKIALLSKGQEAANFAYQALKFNPSANKAYTIIARAYADSANSCGSTPFEKRAVYWLAADVARKGGDAKSAGTYEQYAPTKAEIFESGMAGKTINIGCWINKPVKVPSI